MNESMKQAVPGASGAADANARSIEVSRRFAATRELVWEAFTRPEHIPHWWGPNGFNTTIHEMDVRPGGTWRFMMHGPDGTDYPNRVIYREVVRPERLMYDQDDDGAGRHSFRATVTFVEDGDGTLVTLRLVAPTVEHRDWMVQFGAVEGGTQTLARLADYLTTM